MTAGETDSEGTVAVNQTHARSGAEPPITAEALLALDNVAAKREPPAHVAEQLATRRLYLSGGDGGEGIERAVQGVDRHADSVSLSLAASVAVGLPGRTLKVFNREELEAVVGEVHHAPGFMPEWAELVYHPKVAAPPASKWMRTFDGRRVAPLPYFIYGADNRHIYYPKGYPWHCIGKVDLYSSAEAENPYTWGSGVLIGDRIVLTAGHLASFIDNPRDWKMRFTAAMYNGSSIVGPGAVSYVSDSQWFGDGLSGHDIGLIRLYEPLGTSLGYFGAKTYDRSWNNGNYWILSGYGKGIPVPISPSRQFGIAVLDEDSDAELGAELEHHGDLDIGDSGGPFFGFWEGDPIPYAVGTTSGHEYPSSPPGHPGEDNNIEAGGALMVLAIAAARLAWPA
jgi:V8-like Glu-specific endopeptidase